MSQGKEFLRLRIATYNIHKCRGLDGRRQPGRIASVLTALRPDVAALQEVVGVGPRGMGQEEGLSTRLGMAAFLSPARKLRGHVYGNAVLSRLPIMDHGSHDLSQDGYEPRVCQRVDVLLRGHPIHIYNVHLGTAAAERRAQAERLIHFLLGSKTPGAKIVLGDFNEWKKGPATKLLCEKLQSLDLLPFLKWRRTYPGIFPLFHLDHIYYQGRVEIEKVEVPRTWSALVASDHMPLLAELSIRVWK